MPQTHCLRVLPINPSNKSQYLVTDINKASSTKNRFATLTRLTLLHSLKHRPVKSKPQLLHCFNSALQALLAPWFFLFLLADLLSIPLMFVWLFLGLLSLLPVFTIPYSYLLDAVV